MTRRRVRDRIPQKRLRRAAVLATPPDRRPEIKTLEVLNEQHPEVEARRNLRFEVQANLVGSARGMTRGLSEKDARQENTDGGFARRRSRRHPGMFPAGNVVSHLESGDCNR